MALRQETVRVPKGRHLFVYRLFNQRTPEEYLPWVRRDLDRPGWSARQMGAQLSTALSVIFALQMVGWLQGYKSPPWLTMPLLFAMIGRWTKKSRHEHERLRRYLLHEGSRPNPFGGLEPITPTQRVLLWTAMVGGVLVLVWLAFALG